MNLEAHNVNGMSEEGMVRYLNFEYLGDMLFFVKLLNFWAKIISHFREQRFTT